MIEWVIDALRPQVGALMISANRNQAHYAAYGVPVVTDALTGFPGPLAGILSTLRAASTDWVLTVPCDGPLLPRDLATRLIAAIAGTGANLAVASDGASLQPVYALVPVGLVPSLERRLAARQHRAEDWIRSHQPAIADFTDQPMAFANANTAADIASLERIIAMKYKAERTNAPAS
jgi:molybdopterin-guanine dinucleotide biosynthesis protein A